MSHYTRAYRRIRRAIVCGSCGALKSDATLTRIERGRVRPRLCSACYRATPEGKREQTEIRAAGKARDRARLQLQRAAEKAEREAMA